MVESLINMLIGVAVLGARVLMPLFIVIFQVVARISMVLLDMLFGWLGNVFGNAETRPIGLAVGGVLAVIGIITLIVVNS